MLKNDLLLRAARRERTERTPVWLMRQAGRFDPRYREIRARSGLPLEELFRQPHLAAEISLLPKRLGVDAIIVFQDILTPLAPMGARFVFRPVPILESPIRTAHDVEALRAFDPAEKLDFVAQTLRLLAAELNGDLPLLGFAGAPLTLAFFLIEGQSPHLDGTEAKSLMRADPRLFRKLLDRLADMTADYLAMQIEAGADAVQLFESAADLLSPEEYAEFAHPYQVKVFAKLGRRVPTILFAKDYPQVELMAETGAEVLSVGTCVDLAEAKRRFGQRVAFQGNVDNRVLLEGTPAEIDAAVGACIRAGAHEGHILNLGHGILKDTPFENVCRFIQTAKMDRVSGKDKTLTASQPDMNDANRDVIVVGGGISGLTTAWQLKHSGVDVCLLEERPDAGGVTRTTQRDGFLLEQGPFNVIVRDPTFEDLLEGVADEAPVVSASRAARTRYLYRRERLLAVPSDPVRLVTSPLLSMGAKWRLVSGLFASPRSDGTEETIAEVGIRRFGQEITDTMISAVIAGIFAGDIRRLSLKACFPTVARIDREARSLIGYGLASAFRSRRGKEKKHRRKWRGLVSLDGGLGALTATLARSLEEDCVCGCRVEEIRPANGGYEVRCERDDGEPQSLYCRHLVLATPAEEVARLLGPTVPEAAAILDTVESASMVVLNLGFRGADLGHPLNGFGFLVPHNEPDFPLMGILWADSIFPHHAPPDHRLIRVFIGGSRTPEVLTHPDDELLSTALDASRGLLELSGDPVLVDICRYPAAIPQYGLGYLDKIERLTAVIAAQPALDLVGNYLEGVSLNDCVRCATRVAGEIIRRNRTRRTVCAVPAALAES